LQQLILDVRSVLAAADYFYTDDMQQAADALIDRATQLYCLDHQAEPSEIDFPSQWFQAVIDRKLPPEMRIPGLPEEDEEQDQLPTPQGGR
jgi:hypothetical protein